jgi:hypothetical protein
MHKSQLLKQVQISSFDETCNVTYDVTITYSKVQIVIVVQRKRLAFSKEQPRVDPLLLVYPREKADRTSL